ncbi:hypothetical protein BDK51DRAFT_27174 [Blyttiomyces helicus]|uniref:Ankyrin repeat-containing domain protein n=1 Tax=Blyttiomyces helicus TaxID=388810 RepID=A0A4P9W249_9FUNG|nr:hypothetical protein BDK51DRAFT_27174 [Blyttiomyces helicus]|eukprot:RKO84848.1 hypothetical protein BDK51DRAFT_27174 [Blyttiomyces helicus]
MAVSTPPRLMDELIDQIVELLPVRVAVSLRRNVVLRKHIRAGKLRRPIQRALNRIDLDALRYFARICPEWKSTCPQWDCISAEYVRGLDGKDDEDDEEEEEEETSHHSEEEEAGDDPDMLEELERSGTHLVIHDKALPDAFTRSALDVAAYRSNDLDLIRFLHEFRTEGCTTEAMDSAVMHGRQDVVRFLHEHRTEGCTTRAMDSAVINWATSAEQAAIAFGLQQATAAALRAQTFKACSPRDALMAAYLHGAPEILRTLYEAGERLTDEDVMLLLDPSYRAFTLDRSAAQAFLREMHGLLQLHPGVGAFPEEGQRTSCTSTNQSLSLS